MELRCKILVLEDDPDMREALGEVLEDAGHQVVLAKRGEEAIAEAAKDSFDLVVSDIKMPGMDGLEAVGKVMESQPSIKTIIITGYSTEEHTLRAVRLGVSDFMKKPFKLDELLGRVNEILATRKRELERSRQAERLETVSLGALRTIATLLDSNGEAGLLAAARSAARVASSEIGPGQGAKAEIVTLLAGCQTLSGSIALPDFGAQLEELASQVGERWDGEGPQKLAGEQIPLLSRIAKVALFVAVKPDRKPPTGLLDPALQKLFGSAEQGQEIAQGSGLLSLGRTMELANDLETAHQAYLELLDEAPGSAQEIGARLGLARIAKLAGDDNLLELAGKAFEAAITQGTARLAKTSLELGLLLLGRDGDRSRQYLVQSRKDSLELGRSVDAGLASLGLAAAGESWDADCDDAVRLMSLPEQSATLQAALEWLLPLLLEQGHPAAARFLRADPAALNVALETDALSAQARLRAVEIFRESGPPASGAILRRLAEAQEREVREQALGVLAGKTVAKSPLLRIYCFGPFEVYLGNERLEASLWKRKKVRYLLACLAWSWKAPLAEDKILEEFWPGPADRAKRSLYQATWELRRSLKFDAWPDLDYLKRSGGFFSLQGHLWTDIREFEQAHEQALSLEKAGREGEALSLHRRAVQSVRGPFLDDCYQDWACLARESIKLRLLSSHEKLGESAFAEQAYRTARDHAREMMELDSLHQIAHLLMMNSYTQEGRPQDAIRHFKVCEKSYQQELGIEPSTELLRAFHLARMAV